jgi:hypothetical protein
MFPGFAGCFARLRILHTAVRANLLRQLLEQEPCDTILVAKFGGAEALVEVADQCSSSSSVAHHFVPLAGRFQDLFQSDPLPVNCPI